MRREHNWWDKYLVDVPEGKSGDWEVKRFSISDEEAKHHNVMASFSFSCRGQHVYPGSYTMLTCGKKLVMSDTPSEIRDHLDVIGKAKGHVLIGGLGLGMVVAACLEKGEDIVGLVTVVEISPDVVKLVGHHLYDKFGYERLEIIQDDIFTWQPPKGVKYDVAWFDVWDNVCGDAAPEMSKLKRRFARKAEWKGCWREWEMRRANREDRKSFWWQNSHE